MLNLRIVVAAFLVVAVTACGDEPPPAHESGVDSATATTPAEPVAALPPTEFMASAMLAGPDTVLALLLHWDTLGLRFDDSYREALYTMYCYRPDDACASDEPGWDMATLVRGYSIAELIREPDTAAFAITFDAAARLSSMGIEAAEVSHPDTIRFKRMNGKWRIVSVESQMPPHFGLGAALLLHAKSSADSAMLREVFTATSR